MNLIWYIFIVLPMYGTFDEIEYPTNFYPLLRWTQNSIHYGAFSSRNEEKLRETVKKEIEKFTRIFNSSFVWVEELDQTKLQRLPRYLIFGWATEDCGDADAFNSGPSSISLSPYPDSCGKDEPMALILRILGFTHLIKRRDRDRFIIVNWQNLQLTAASEWRRQRNLANSTNPAFKHYDIQSILHPAAFQDDAVDPTVPIYTPVNKKLEPLAAIKDKDRKVSAYDKLYFKAIYP